MNLLMHYSLSIMNIFLKDCRNEFVVVSIYCLLLELLHRTRTSSFNIQRCTSIASDIVSVCIDRYTYIYPLRAHIYTRAKAHTFTHAKSLTHTHLHTHIYIYIQICIYAYKTHIHIHTHTYIQICICI